MPWLATKYGASPDTNPIWLPVVAKYSLRGMEKPIDVSEYELTRALPKKFKSMLPTIEEIEAELSASLEDLNREKKHVENPSS